MQLLPYFEWFSIKDVLLINKLYTKINNFEIKYSFSCEEEKIHGPSFFAFDSRLESNLLFLFYFFKRKILLYSYYKKGVVYNNFYMCIQIQSNSGLNITCKKYIIASEITFIKNNLLKK